MSTLCPKCGEDVVDRARFCHACGQDLTVKSRPVLAVEHPTPVAHYEVEYAPVWRRFLASLIDIVLLALVVLPGVIAFFWLVEVFTHLVGLDMEEGRSLAGTAAVLLGLTADWIYHAATQSSSREASLGKQFMGLKVTDLAGERISFGQATGRHFAKYLSTFMLLFGFVVAFFSRRKQAIHDMVAGTLVLRR